MFPVGAFLVILLMVTRLAAGQDAKPNDQCIHQSARTPTPERHTPKCHVEAEKRRQAKHDSKGMGTYKKWLDEDVVWIITYDDPMAFLPLLPEPK
jgi:hypothetical protein